MSRRITNRISLCSIVTLSFLGLAANECLAQGSHCQENATFKVCVEWNLQDNPDHTQDYRVTFDGTNPPDLELLKGNSGWIVFCEEADNPGVPASIGNFTTPGGDANYKIQIRNGTAAGFKNVGSASLVPANGKSSSIQAAEGGLSSISGNLNGLTLTVGSPASGGVMENLLVTGDLTDPLTVTTVKGPFNSIGDVIGDADVTITEINGGSIIFKSLGCAGAVCPDITVTGRLFDGLLKVSNDVASGSTVKIEELEEADPATEITLVELSRASLFAGTLDLPNGLANADTKIQMGGTFSGVMNLHGGAVVGELAVYIGTTTAEIKNGGAVSGDVYLSQNLPFADNKYEGTATFASVTSTGEIGTSSLDPDIDADIGGTLNINGDVEGVIEIIGSILSGAEIIISGDLSGDVDIEDDLTGSLTIKGALDNSGLTGGGRILVAGLCDGPIKIHGETDTLSLIHLLEGLDDNGSIEINVDRGNYSAGGDIQLGPTSLPADVVFDGCIHIYDNNEVVVEYGDLDGDITVTECHDTDDDLDVCIDGDVNGTIIIGDSGCTPNVDDWSCPQAGCP